MALFKKKKSTVKPDLPKEYVWTLEVDGEDHIYKCLVTETEVITYEDGREHKHLKIMDSTCMEGVLQIDVQTRIFGEMTDFQLERFIPYIRLDGHWVMSDTTEKDRRNEQIAIYNKSSIRECITGFLFLGALLAIKLIFGEVGEWWILSIFGILFLSSAANRTVRLRNEINLLRELEEEAAAKKAAAADNQLEGIDAIRAKEE